MNIIDLLHAIQIFSALT